MIETIVSAALHAVVASVILGALLGGLVLLIVRTLALSAAARHALWTIALVATAVMPLAGIGVSGLRALAPVVTADDTVSAVRATRSAVKQFPLRPTTSSTSRTIAKPNPLSSAQFPVVSAFPWELRLPHAVALGIVVVWLVGASLGIVTLLFSVGRVRALKKHSSPLEGELAGDLPWLTQNLATEREIYLRLSHEIETPVAVGFRRPVILIPTELIAADGLRGIEELVMHEHAHLRRYDDWTNLAQRAIERLFWFNPLVWIVGGRIALEREIAADDAVVARTGRPKDYAQSLWRLAREMRMPEHAIVAPGALLTRKQITIRIESLIAGRKTIPSLGPIAAAGIGVASLLCVALIATSAPAIELPAPAPNVAAVSVAAPPVPPHAVANVTASHAAAHIPATRVQVASTTAQVPATTVHVPGTIVHIPVVHIPATTVLVPPTIVHVPPTTVHVPAVDIHSPPIDISRIVEGNVAAAERKVADSQTAIEHALSHDEVAHVAQTTTSTSGSAFARILAHCIGCDLSGRDLRNADLRGTKLTGVDLSHADLRGAVLDGSTWSGVDLSHARLDGASLVNVSFSGVDIEGITLTGAHTDGLRMTGVSLSGMDLHALNVRALLDSCTGCDLAGADLHGLDLHGIHLIGADLQNANLRGANLSGAQFTGADLEGADLRGARIDGASFTGADIKGMITE
jgi:uncharacterized protein YjbI with pentapeptide repeats/beta-lactamase regulating signal transducer with metallopeptidase domain